MSNLTQAALSDAIKTQYEKRLQIRALPRLVHGRFGTEARLNKVGSYELRKYGSLGIIASALGEGSTPAEQSAPSLTLTTITPLFYGSWIGHTDELELTVFDPLISEVSGILGEQAGLSADTLVRNVLTAGATKDFSGGAASRGALDAPLHNVTFSDFVKSVATLEAANALPVEGDRFVVIIHPHTWATLMQDPTFVNLFIQTDPGGDSNPLRSGYVGHIMRCSIYVSSNAREYVDEGLGSTTDVYSMLFIARESYGTVGFAGTFPNLMVDGQGEKGRNMTGMAVKPVTMIIKQLGSAGADDPLNQRATIGWKMSLATSVLNSAWLLDLEHTNAFSDDV
jgi:N4-gp56 family major capsid protein